MESLVRLMGVPSPCTTYPSLIPSHRGKRPLQLRAKLDEQGDSLYQCAVCAASLCFQEAQHSEPLFVEPYSGCFAFFPEEMRLITEGKRRHPYCIATKFIDDKLLQNIDRMDGLRQVVLLSDGMNIRTFRLNWPTSTVILGISPERVFKQAADQLEGSKRLFVTSHSIGVFQHSAGFEVRRFRQQPVECIDHSGQHRFLHLKRVYPASKQLSPVILPCSTSWLCLRRYSQSLAACSRRVVTSWESCLVGLLKLKWGLSPRKLFMNNGLRMEVVSYEDIARDLGEELMPQEYRKLLFVVEQLRFSDDQMESWRRDFQSIEEEGDEEGFEEL